jgi:hypothetical protein
VSISTAFTRNRKEEMVNHPHRGRSYWVKEASANTYMIGIATRADHAQQYVLHGFARIDRERARRALSDTGNAVFCTVTIDGQPAPLTRFEVARSMKKGPLAA